MHLLLLLTLCIIHSETVVIVRENTDDAQDNIYWQVNNITHEKAYNLSKASHSFMEKMGYGWPDYDPLVFPNFHCATKRPTPHVKPTSVHKLTPYDIDVVAAMGDSITAGFGARSYTLIDLFVEYRGVSWSIGGDEKLKTRITIPNILKRFNPALRGYSLGDTPALIPLPWEHLNLAVSGATTEDLKEQADKFVQRLKADPKYDFANSWKLLTIFIGGNDLCSVCRKKYRSTGKYSPENYIKGITELLDYLSNNVPRLFVNMIEAPDVTMLNNLRSWKCDFTHYLECKCGTVYGEAERNFTRSNLHKYHSLLQDLLVHSGRYDDKDDFAAVLQPFFDSTVIPRNKDGSVDTSFWAPDCFHFSWKAHAASAIGLWNNMNQPVGKKTRKWTVGDKYLCPSHDKPYFYTNRNSEVGVEMI